MTHPLLDALIRHDAVTPIADGAAFDALVNDGDARLTAVFFTGDPAKKLETADVAVVLRELLDGHAGALRGALVQAEAEADLMKRCGVFALPGLAFFAGPEHLETIPKIQDWSVYAEKVPTLIVRAGAVAA